MAKRITDRLSGLDRVLQIGMASLGAILLFGALGVVLKSAIGPHRPAMVEFREVERDVIGGRTRVQIEAANRGDVTASSVTIEGRRDAGQMASVTLDYVPGQSRKAATMTFAGNMGQAPISLEATGWVDP